MTDHFSDQQIEDLANDAEGEYGAYLEANGLAQCCECLEIFDKSTMSEFEGSLYCPACGEPDLSGLPDSAFVDPDNLCQDDYEFLTKTGQYKEGGEIR